MSTVDASGMAPITDTLIYDTLCEVMDLVAAVGKKVDRLLSAAGIEDAPAGLAEGGSPDG